MKSKPKGQKYRNLTLRGGVIYYRRMMGGRRVRVSLETSDWEIAAQAKDIFERHKMGGRGAPVEVPRFEAFAARYLAEAKADLAGTTREDRVKLLRPGGIVARPFAGLRLDAITKPMLIDWWQREVEGKKRSPRTGLNYLSALAGVLNYAVDLELLEENPVDGLRSTLRRRRRTKRGRADADRAAHVRPIEAAVELQ